MKKNGRLVAIALGSVLCASCVGGAFLVAGSTPAAETVKAADAETKAVTLTRSDLEISGSSNSSNAIKEFEKDGVTFGGRAINNSLKNNYIFMNGNDFIYNKTAPEGYYLSTISVSYQTNGSSSSVCFFNFSSSVLNSYTSSGTSHKSNPGNDFSISNEDESAAYGNISCDPSTNKKVQFSSITFEFSEKTAYDHISIANYPAKTNYYVGDRFLPEGIIVNAFTTSEDLNPIDVTDKVDWLVNPEIFESAGDGVEVTVMAQLGELTAQATYTVNVKEPATVTSLEVQGLEGKKYTVGESFGLDGLTVYANMSDGVRIDVTGELDFDPHVFTLEEGKSGVATITLSYKGFEKAIEVETGFMSIAEARGLSKEVTIVGVITGKMRDPNSQYKNSDFYLNDGTAGLRAFRVDDSLSSELKFGDRVIMTGTPELYSGFYELTDVSYVEVIEEGVEPEPLQITEFSADALEGKDGMYVSLSGLSYKDGSLWAANKRDTMTFSFAGGDVDAHCVLDSDAKVLQDELNNFFDKIEGLKFDYTGNMTFFYSDPQISPISIDEFSCPDYDAVMAFVKAYMHPEVSHDDTDEGNACLEWYPTAKKALEGLTEAQQDYFLTSNATADYAARYNAWATAYGDGATSSLGRIMSSNDTAAIIALVALSSATVAAAGFMIASRRRKAK